MNTQLELSGLQAEPVERHFEATRATGLARLNAFVSRAGRAYAAGRNYDLGTQQRAHVSFLSPWVRHRLISEEEVLRAVLARQSFSRAEKFIQEVFWRGYFKGWLEQHPSVWRDYKIGLRHALKCVEARPAAATDYAEALEGRTSIDCFDHWARELVDTGYLHNHARMWFASIWIFTLRLPWELGADFFLRHLLDADPASNTLSWRWVAGLHTKGKAYQARAANINKYTNGRFNPLYQLANDIVPLVERTEHPTQPIPDASPMPEGAFVYLLHEEDCSAETWLPHRPAATVCLPMSGVSSPLPASAIQSRFVCDAVSEASLRLGAEATPATDDWIGQVRQAAEAAGTATVVTAYAPVGPVADRLTKLSRGLAQDGIALHRVRRPYDNLVWPHARRGFFGLKKKIPGLLRELGLQG